MRYNNIHALTHSLTHWPFLCYLQSTTTTLCQPFTKTFAKRAFRYSAPAVGNSLPKSGVNNDSVKKVKVAHTRLLFLLLSFLWCRNVWKFIQKVSKDAYSLTDYISRHLETSAQLLKKCPDKWSVISSVFITELNPVWVLMSVNQSQARRQEGALGAYVRSPPK